ncbi:MAG TPA: hypothetical protein VGR73_09605 [Bryobacteraceae bacterium]|nr:hypothetical protein [Bryobacteraceae bacterium]
MAIGLPKTIAYARLALLNNSILGIRIEVNTSFLGNDPSNTGKFGCGCSTPDVAAGNPLVGSGSSRVMQLGLKLTF